MKLKLSVIANGAAIAALGAHIRTDQYAAERERRFDLWQESECIYLGLTIDEHNELLNKAGIAEVKGFPNMYSAVRNVITAGH